MRLTLVTILALPGAAKHVSASEVARQGMCLVEQKYSMTPRTSFPAETACSLMHEQVRQLDSSRLTFSVADVRSNAGN